MRRAAALWALLAGCYDPAVQAGIDARVDAPEGVAGCIVEVAVGGLHGCARLGDGEVQCWGNDQNGELGDGESGLGHDRGTPAPVPDLTAIDIELGESFSCASVGGTIFCWGGTFDTVIGPGAPSPTTSPLMVPGLPAFAGFDLGASFGCGWTGDGMAWCWGDADGGQTGTGEISDAIAPTLAPWTPTQVIGTGTDHTCALADDQVTCAGNNDWGQLGTPISATTMTCTNHDGAAVSCSPSPASPVPVVGAVALALGNDHSCALTNMGAVFCWGGNEFGQLGDGTTTTRPNPVAVSLSGRAVALAAGRSHTCAIVEGGDVFCWGANLRGQLGDGTRADRSTPVKANVAGPATGVSSHAWANHTCVLVGDREVWCWGANGQGQAGAPPADPADVLTPNRVSLPCR